MSFPWLSKNKSRSRSPTSDKSRTKTDQFGRSLPSRSSSRSRSRSSSSRDRSHSSDRRNRGEKRNLSHGHKDGSGGRPGKFNKRERRSGKKRNGSSSSSSSSSSNSSSSDSSSSSNSTRIVASTKPKYLNARVFVANIITKEVTKEELVKQFEKYGNVIDVLVHSNNYAFIQYSKEEHARLAVEGENGSTLKGWRMDVKMANENRKGNYNSAKTGGRGDDRGGKAGGHFGNLERIRPPPHGGPLWDPFLDPYYGGRPRPPVPFPVGMRDPYFIDPFRRGFPDPWLGDDPYRRSLYPDPYREMLRPPAPLPPVVIECEIFVTNAKLQAYGQAVEQRIKDQKIITSVSVMTADRTAAQLVEELTAQSGLFAIFINPQNEMHRSLTLNILHGLPQEHRNMPLDDAVTLVGKSFLAYVEGLREKAQAAATPLPSSSSAPINSRVFLPASQEVSYLLNLLADNRALTVEELNSVIVYLQERRDKLIDAESRPLVNEVSTERFRKSPPLEHSDFPPTTRQEPAAVKIPDSASLAEDLTSKILSLFGSAGGKIKGVPPADQFSQSKYPTGAPAPSTQPQASAPSTASLINFDNPNVQKALDSLIKNTPSFLKKMNTKTPAAQSDASSLASIAGTMSGSGSYRQSDETASGYRTQRQLPNSQNLGVLQDDYEFIQQMSSSGQGSTGIPPPMGDYNVSGGQQGPMGRVYEQPEY